MVKQTILILNDNRQDTEALAATLTKFGYRTAPFFDGPTAIQQAETLRPDLMLRGREPNDVVFTGSVLVSLSGVMLWRRFAKTPTKSKAAGGKR